ncbi:MAG: hypothetical protein RMJ67_05965 [Elusimicrobiota bacterium]|nr:hypothetical protein [Endomicrobiia bacterium]MDW8166038.1 hypothetical protein [Elusimicrobiota bacterium]
MICLILYIISFAFGFSVGYFYSFLKNKKAIILIYDYVSVEDLKKVFKNIN